MRSYPEIRDATKQISKGTKWWPHFRPGRFPPHFLPLPALCPCEVMAVERAKLCQRKIAAQFIAKVHYSANVASLG